MSFDREYVFKHSLTDCGMYVLRYFTDMQMPLNVSNNGFDEISFFLSLTDGWYCLEEEIEKYNLKEI